MREEKNEIRKHLSSLTFTEKIRILEKLRDRSLMLAASGLRPKGLSQREANASTKKQNEG